MTELRSALDYFDDFRAACAVKPPAFFLDFDGTLAPIVARPEEAALDEAVRQTLIDLARRFPLAVVSGRDRQDVVTRVGLTEAYYAGSHGFDITGPQGFAYRNPEGEARMPALERAARALDHALAGYEGTLIERKRYAIAIHFRSVAPIHHEAIASAVRQAKEAEPDLRLKDGKCIFELQPDTPWHKGAAVTALLGRFEAARGGHCPIYIGDDVTDEDGFAAVEASGFGIYVGDHHRATTRASYFLADPEQVATFLAKFTQL